MKSIRIIVLAAVAAIVMSVSGQTTTVKGVLKDSTLNEPEPYATVRVFSKDNKSNPTKMFLTKDDGSFNVIITGKGVFDFVFSSVGKEDKRIAVELGSQPTIDLGTVLLHESATALQGVEIVAQKPLVKMEVDRMSYNVSEDADSKTATVLDMLRKVPMVTVDGQDNITVNGSSSFKVYVDGKPNVMFSSNPSVVFKSMPATVVKNIEVVTNPGAKYDAEGVGGVLNIVMNRQTAQAQQNMDGYTGTVQASAGTRGFSGGLFMSGQKGKLSYSGNLAEHYQMPGKPDVLTEQMNGETTIATQTRAKTRIPFTMGNVSLGYELSPTDQLNATFGITSFMMRNSATPTTRMYGGALGDGFSYITDAKVKNRNTSLNGNIDYQHYFNAEKTSSMVLTYQINHTPTHSETDNDFIADETVKMDLSSRHSDNKDYTTEHIFQADFTTPIATRQQLDFGAKMMMRRATSDARFFYGGTFSEDMSMDYLYKNNVAAGYAEYSGKWGALSTKAGMRYEHTWQNVEYRKGNGEDFKKNYGSLVPTASLSYSLAPTSNIGLTYNMRISRPGITYLNPYVNRADPNSLTYGNTDLDVEKSHNLSVVFNSFSQRLMMSLNMHYNFSDNGIEQYSFYDGTLQNTTYGNIVKRKQAGVNGYVNWLLAKNTRVFVNAGLDYYDLRSDLLAMKNSGWHANAVVGLQQTLPCDIKLGAYAICQTKNYTLQGWSGGFNLLSMNISKSLLNDRLSIGLQGMVGMSGGGNIKIESYSSGKDFMSHQRIKVPLSGVSLTLSYNFGNLKRQVRQQQSRVQSDYIEQQSQGEMLNNVGGMGNMK